MRAASYQENPIGPTGPGERSQGLVLCGVHGMQQPRGLVLSEARSVAQGVRRQATQWTSFEAPGYLEARCSYIHYSRGPVLSNASSSAMPVCPYPSCPCGHKKVSAEVLINHVQSSSWGGRYLCATCRCVCKSETVLIHHKQKVHKIGFAAVPSQKSRASSSSALSCRVCDRPYPTLNALEQHYRDTPVHPKCTRCNVGFVDNAAMQAHAASVHRPITLPVFTCRICSSTYPTSSALEQHYRDAPVHPKCTRCNTGFVDNVAIQAHVVSIHRPITCGTCNGLQIYQEDIAHHYRISPKHPSCTPCDIGFEDKEALDQHTNARHPEFRCRTCDLPFGSAALLEAHYQESPRHPRCPECRLSFEDNLALIKHVIAIFNPLIKDSGRLILKTSQMSLHDAFSEASIISRASRSPSVACSLREPSIDAITPTRSVASPMSILQRQLSTPPPTHSPAVVSDPEGGFREAIPSASPHDPASSLSSPSLISRAASASDRVIVLDSFEEHGEFEHDPESTLPSVPASSKRSPPLSVAGSIGTRSIVAASPSYRSETRSPVSSAQSIFGKAPSIISTPCAQATATGPTSGVIHDMDSVSPVNVSPSKQSLAETSRYRASSLRSSSADTRTGGSPSSIARSSFKTVSPPPTHVVVPSPGLRERFRMALASTTNNSSRAGSLPKSRDSERSHSPEPDPLRRQPSPAEKNSTEAEPNLELVKKLPASPTPSPTVGAPYPSAQPPTDLAPCERLVSYVYCRMCRRDPCRQPAATMCGHVFCYKCISSEVVKTSRCPVCEAPTLLYSIFRLHLV
ncbi:hypothetical protein BJV74DRAFT_959616 [Russula compacta]|nr:hypothetical protein BJV74DRAFT_959616 [Russula compacta]